MNSKTKKIIYVFSCIIVTFIIFCLLHNPFKKDEPKVSVIIPCYNSSAYLPDLFVMLKSQTLGDYELIFVDDGSTDNTNSLIKAQQTNDNRIKLITLETNKGAGNARNVGLKYAKGKYVIFLDSDDIFLPNLLKDTYEVATRKDVDILFFDFKCIDAQSKTDCIYLRNCIYPIPIPTNKVFSPDDVKEHVFLISRGIVWNKLYKRDFINKNNLYFLNLKIHNDSFFAYTSYVVAKRMYFMDKALVVYRFNGEKSISNTQRHERTKCIIINIQELKNFLDKKKLFNKYKNALLDIVIKF